MKKIVKKLFDKLFIKDSKNQIETLENKYMNITSKNIYAFQGKYYQQQNKLYKLYGNACNSLTSKLRCIIITDTHNTLSSDKLIKVLNEHPDYDACFLLGDHSGRDIEIVLKYIDKDKIYALLGNHDYNYINDYSLNNLNGNIVNINGLKVMGIEGSFKYKPADFPSFTQEESVKFLLDKEPVDILFSHDGPFNDDMVNNPAHQGLFGITYYLFKNRVKYNIHGHLHVPYEKRLENGTIEISLYDINYLELE